MFVILDEAYAEMRMDGEPCSLFSLVPGLKNRIILMRSATKSLSTAGERMAVTITSNKDIMTKITEESIRTSGHAPISLQHAFAMTMSKFDKKETEHLINHYKPQIDFVTNRLKQMGTALPDEKYRVGGAFYAIANLSELIGLDLPPEGSVNCTKRVLNKTGKITTDEDIAYYLLFNDGVMIAPLSYFDLSPTKGYMRITCSGGLDELTEIMNRLEKRLFIARQQKQKQLQKEAEIIIETLKSKQNSDNIKKIMDTLLLQSNKQERNQEETLALKASNTALQKTLSDAKLILGRFDPDKAAIKTQAVVRGFLVRNKMKKDDEQYARYVMDITSPKLTNRKKHNENSTAAIDEHANEQLAIALEHKRYRFFSHSRGERDVMPWRQHVKHLEEEKSIKPPTERTSALPIATTGTAPSSSTTTQQSHIRSSSTLT